MRWSPPSCVFKPAGDIVNLSGRGSNTSTTWPDPLLTGFLLHGEALDACVSSARLWWLCLLLWLCNRPFRRPFHTCLWTEWAITS